MAAMIRTPRPALAAASAVLFAALSPAQGEHEHLDLMSEADAFAAAENTGKRVLVYQDWPA